MITTSILLFFGGLIILGYIYDMKKVNRTKFCYSKEENEYHEKKKLERVFVQEKLHFNNFYNF